METKKSEENMSKYLPPYQGLWIGFQIMEDGRIKSAGYKCTKGMTFTFPQNPNVLFEEVEKGVKILWSVDHK